MENDEIEDLIASARAGDDGAYAELRDANVGELVDFLFGPSEMSYSEAQRSAELVWVVHKDLIIRAPKNGGWDRHAESFVAYLADLITTVKKLTPLYDEGTAAPHPHGGDERPDRLVEDRSRYSLLLHLLFGKDVGKPHQQLAFVFMYELGGRKTPRGMEGDALKLHQAHSQTPLKTLLEIVHDDFRNTPAFRGEPQTADAYFEFASEPIVKQMAAVQETCFNDYYPGKDPASGPATISRWCNEIRTGMKGALRDAKMVWDVIEKRIQDEGRDPNSD